MKINGTNRIDYVNQAYRKNANNVTNADKKSTSLTTQDSIELSETSKELKKQIEKLSAADTTDKQKIESIKLAIQDGTYRVSPEKLADKMIHTIREQNNTGEE